MVKSDAEPLKTAWIKHCSTLEENLPLSLNYAEILGVLFQHSQKNSSNMSVNLQAQ